MVASDLKAAFLSDRELLESELLTEACSIFIKGKNYFISTCTFVAYSPVKTSQDCWGHEQKQKN